MQILAEHRGRVCVQRNLGLIVLVCTILYAIPRTAILGVILTTASWAVLSASIFVSEKQGLRHNL
ncbi:hypothetical protein GFPCMMHI_01342 [Ensifer adhaerens]|nr:hypothetical protein [Ensifer adhaerens]